MDKIFIQSEDGRIQSLGEISEVELTAETEPDDDIKKHFSSNEMTMTIPIAADSVTDIEKYIICGGDRGRYNGYRLKRDGYLSPKNGWMNDEKT